MVTIHSCDANGTLVFLDIAQDRYFALNADAETAYRRLRGGRRLEQRDLQPLVDAGVVDSQSGMSLVRATCHALPTTDLAGTAKPVAGHPDLVLAIADLIVWRRRLHNLGFARCIDYIAQLRCRSAPKARADRGVRIAAAYARADLWLSPQDRCLPRSLALAARLAARGIAAELVIGVRTRPFLAHSWVEAGGVLLNDRLDRVLTFTPIFVQ